MYNCVSTAPVILKFALHYTLHATHVPWSLVQYTINTPCNLQRPTHSDSSDSKTMQNKLDAPQFLKMVRANDPSITEQDAKSYVETLPTGRQEGSSGCYVIKCMRPCILPIPIACAYNCSCNWCLWPGLSTIPFGCCIVLNGSDERGSYVNLKGDTVVMKVDDENDTLACFAHNSSQSGTVCCYCNKV